ncbi:hypothetical protein MASR1M90_16800 [Desulfovibrionales bacterium]
MTGTSTSRQRVKPDAAGWYSSLQPPANEDVWNAFSELIAAPTFNGAGSTANRGGNPVTLAQLRDTLLPKLISGELRVPDAEAFLKERGL